MSKFTHSRALFIEDDGSPMTFSMRPFSDSNLRDVIEHGGGVLQGTDAPGVLRLVDPKSKVLNVSSSTTMVSLKFIYDCAKSNRILDIDAYTIKLNELVTSDISDDDSSSDLRKSNFCLSKTTKSSNRVKSSSLNAFVKNKTNPVNAIPFKTSTVPQNHIKPSVTEDISTDVLSPIAKKSFPRSSHSQLKTVPSHGNVLNPNIVKLLSQTDKTLSSSSSQGTGKQTPAYKHCSNRSQCNNARKSIYNVGNENNLFTNNFHVSNCLKEIVTKCGSNKVSTVPKTVTYSQRQPQVKNLSVNSQFLTERVGASSSSVNSSNFSHKQSLQPDKSNNIKSKEPSTSIQLSDANKVVRLYENYKQNSLVLPDSLELTIPESSQDSCAGNEPIPESSQSLCASNELTIPESSQISGAVNELTEPESSQDSCAGRERMCVGVGSSGASCYTWQSSSEFEPERIRTASLEVNAASTQNTLDLDEFDTHLLSKLQQSEVNKEAYMITKDEECMSQSYTISSSADPAPSQQNVSTNDSPEIFPDELPDSASQEEVLDNNISKESQSLLVSGAEEIVKTLQEAALLCKTNDKSSSLKMQRSIRKINRLIYEPRTSMEAERVLKKKFLSFEDKCTLVKYMCTVRKEQPEKFLERLCGSSR